MKQAKGENRAKGPTVKVEFELEKALVEQLKTMESYTKIPQAELLTTALKRFISQHKDYFPEANA